MSEWISVDDYLPGEDVEVLVFDDEGNYFLCSHHNTFFSDEFFEPIIATHWQPLPEPPK